MARANGEAEIEAAVEALFAGATEFENQAVIEPAKALLTTFLISQAQIAFSMQRIAKALESLDAQHGAT